MKLQAYKLGDKGIRIAVLADLHNKPYARILAQTRQLQPDIIVVPGDVTFMADGCHRVQGFLSGCSKIAPTYLSLGNHDDLRVIRHLSEDVTLLEDSFVDIALRGLEMRIGGLSSPPSHMGIPACRKPNTAWLADFCRTDKKKILLCHQPEFYPRYLKDMDVDLVLAGHAHGGQWRIPFTDQGVYAPGQGLLPKLTGGIFDDRLVISRGISNSVWIPRFFNPREILLVQL